ncbi:MAG: DegT/DnrJ/EryC1/StrS family aminotransferase [Nitrososphaerales archaeon]
MIYKVPFVNFPEHYKRIKDEIDFAIKEVLLGGDYILRKHLKEFEENFAKFLGVKYAIGVGSGTDALYLSLKAAGINQGDEVITVAHTFVATIASIIHCGAKPILVDIGEDYNMDVEKVEEVITNKTKAIIPVHLNGRLCDMKRLMEIASKYNLIIIEDAAQALGASLDGVKAGTFGLTGCFSFYPAKILGGLGDGGMVVTNNKDVAEKILLLRDHGQKREIGEILCYGFNSRLDNLQAAVLNVKLKYVPKWIERRREIAKLYHQALSNITKLKLPPPPMNGRFYDVYQNYVIRAKRRDELVKHLMREGIEVLISWPKPLHKHEALGLSNFHLPMTEQISKEVVSLPIYPELSNNDVNFVIQAIQTFYK